MKKCEYCEQECEIKYECHVCDTQLCHPVHPGVEQCNSVNNHRVILGHYQQGGKTNCSKCYHDQGRTY